MRSPCRRLLPLLTLVAAGGGCAVGGGPPELRLEPLAPEVGFVGSELTIRLDARDPEDDALRWRFETDVPEMCRSGRCRAGVQPLEGGGAVFRWVPDAADVGTWHFRFHVTDGTTVAHRTTTVEVRSSIGYEGLPRFVQPLGTGTTLDLSRASCVELDVVVDDPDSPGVTIAEEGPRIEGATLTSHDEFTGTWRWCPTEAQLREGGHRRLVLSASDGSNPKTLKSYLIVLRRPPKPGCAAEPPVIDHAPADWGSAGDVRVTAHIRDDGGLKHEPLLYYAATRPGDSPDLGRMTQVTMIRTSGDNRSGVYEGRIPNPAGTLSAGAPSPLYYVIAASDGGDGSDGCEQVAQAPARGAFEIEVRVGSGDAARGAGACEPCSSDRACGGAEDACVRMGTRGDSFCLLGCASDADCSDGYACSPDAVESVDGARRRLCTPRAGTCDPAEAAGCADDAAEDNDTREDVAGREPLAAGAHADLVSCHVAGRDDEDWYPIRLTAEAQVRVSIAGGDATDLDLALYDAEGSLFEAAESLRSTEDLTACLAAGDYFLRVYSFGEGRNEYGLTWNRRAATCERSAVCEPDAGEPDDGADRARRVAPTSGYLSEGNTICSGNDDWYAVSLEAGQTLVVDLAFIQTSADEDLDLHFLDSSGTDLTPCTEADPSTCSAFQGQSADSNEHYEHRVTAAGTYYVVVHGFAGAESSYDIRVRVL